MTTNERIARWLGWDGPFDAFTAPYPWVEPGTCPEDERYHWGVPDYEHDIRCWHGEHGILAKIEEKGLRGQFLRQLGDGTMPADQVSANKSAEANLQELLWRICRAEAPQLAAALDKVIEEGRP